MRSSNTVLRAGLRDLVTVSKWTEHCLEKAAPRTRRRPSYLNRCLIDEISLALATASRNLQGHRCSGFVEWNWNSNTAYSMGSNSSLHISTPPAAHLQRTPKPIQNLVHYCRTHQTCGARTSWIYAFTVSIRRLVKLDHERKWPCRLTPNRGKTGGGF